MTAHCTNSILIGSIYLYIPLAQVQNVNCPRALFLAEFSILFSIILFFLIHFLLSRVELSILAFHTRRDSTMPFLKHVGCPL